MMLKIILALGVGFFLGQLVLFLLMFAYVKIEQKKKLKYMKGIRK